MPNDDQQQSRPSRPDPRVDPDATMASDLNRPPVDDDTLATQAGHDPDATVITGQGGEPRPASGTAVTMPMPGDGYQRTPTNLVLDGQTLGDFAIEYQLGQGGMGAVFKGRQVSLDRPVAIKVLPSHLTADASFIERFQLEARAVAKLTSPYIVQVYGAGKADGLHYFAMEFVAGKDLSQRLKEGLRPTPQEAVALTLQAAKGLAAAAAHGIIHRDIKPHNMMVTDTGELKIMDFGLVKVADSGQGLTMAGAVMGTVSYFSPEQGRGLPCDHRTDIYALGVVLYEILSGTLPFTGSDPTAVIYQHIHSQPRPPIEINPDIPEDLQAVALKCMQKRPEDRYQQATDLVADLERIAHGLAPIEALRDPAGLRNGAVVHREQPFAAERRSVHPVGLLLLVVLAGSTVAAWWWYDHLLPLVLGDASAADLGDAMPSEPAAPTDPAVQAVSVAVAAGDWDRAEELLARPRTVADDPAWAALEQQVRAGRSQALADQAAVALDRFDLATAVAAIDALAALSPEDSRLDSLRSRLGQARERGDYLSDLRRRLETGEAAPVIAACDSLLAEGGADPGVSSLRERARAMDALLQTADDRLADGAHDTARSLYTKLLADDPNDMARRGIRAVDLDQSLREAITAGRLDAAVGLLEELRQLLPGSLSARRAGKRLAVEQRLATGRAALASGDEAAVEAVIAALRADDPASPHAGQLAQELAGHRAVRALEDRIAAGDLPGARAQLAHIEDGDFTPALQEEARSRFAAARLEEQAAAAAAAEREARIVAAFTELAESLEPVTADPEAGEEVLAALIARYGADRPEVVPMRERLAVLRDRGAAVALLAAVDLAVLSGLPSAWEALVADDALRVALTELADTRDLVFDHRLRSVSREGDALTVEAVLRHGFAIYPERDITARYRLEPVADGWVIATAQFETTAP